MRRRMARVESKRESTEVWEDGGGGGSVYGCGGEEEEEEERREEKERQRELIKYRKKKGRTRHPPFKQPTKQSLVVCVPILFLIQRSAPLSLALRHCGDSTR